MHLYFEQLYYIISCKPHNTYHMGNYHSSVLYLDKVIENLNDQDNHENTYFSSQL